MAAIIDTRTHHGAGFRPSRPPRHLSAVAVTIAAEPGHGPRVVHLPVGSAAEPLLTPSTITAMVAAVLVAMVLAIGVGAGAFSSLVPTPGSAPIAAAEARVVVVEPGDSVWSIARSLQPEGDVRPLVHTIVQANGAEPLQPGQEILVPR